MNDTWTERVTVLGIILLGFTSIFACVILHYVGGDHSPPLCNIAATCVGALAGMAIPIRASKRTAGELPPP